MPGARTAPDIVELVRTTLASLGKLPILVRRDVPGFISSVQAPPDLAGVAITGGDAGRDAAARDVALAGELRVEPAP